MKIEILGTGCSKCQALAANVETALKKSGIAAEIVKVDKIEDIIRSGVMTTPALVIDGKVRAAGRILSAADIGKLLRSV